MAEWPFLLGAQRARGSALGLAIFLGLFGLFAGFLLIGLGPIEFPAGTWPRRLASVQGPVLLSLLLATAILLLVLRQAVRADQVNLPLLRRLELLCAWFAAIAATLHLAGTAVLLLALDEARPGLANLAATRQGSMAGAAVMVLPVPYLFALSPRRRVETAEQARAEHGWLA